MKKGRMKKERMKKERTIARKNRHKIIENAVQELAKKFNLTSWTITIRYYHRADSLNNNLAFTDVNDAYKQINIGIIDTKELDRYDIHRIIAHELGHARIGLPARIALKLLKQRYTEQEQEAIRAGEETAVEWFVQIIAPLLGLPINAQLPAKNIYPLEIQKKGGENV